MEATYWWTKYTTKELTLQDISILRMRRIQKIEKCDLKIGRGKCTILDHIFRVGPRGKNPKSGYDLSEVYDIYCWGKAMNDR